MTMLIFLIVGCQTKTPPNIRFYAEIPFRDCAEGVYVESVSRLKGFIPCKEWTRKRPFMIMIDPDGKKEIFKQWNKACRYAGEDCEIQLKSVMEMAEKLDKIAETILKP